MSQKHMLEKFANDNGWAVYGCYLDDGWSGMNYERPEFKRMIADIEAGKINLVACKDLSRLGRSYIETGRYTDFYFPERGVRFIALNDGIDSMGSDNDIAPFRNVLNQMYSTDISKKVRSAVRAKKQRGEFLSAFAPYGYRKDPNDNNRLLVEEGGAETVRRMFEMCTEGHGSKAIAKTLNGEGIPSPLCHRDMLLGRNPGRESRWHAETVSSMLKNRIYVGDMVQGIYDCPRFKRAPNRRRPKEDRIVTPGTHRAIVTPEIWEQAQNSIASRKRVMRTGGIQLFAGFVKCGDCGYALSYANSQGIEQYTCGQYRRHGREACSCHYIRKDVLTEIVLGDIRKHASLAREDEHGLARQLLSANAGREERRMRMLESELAAAEARHGELDGILKHLFEQSAAGTVTESRFRKLGTEYETEQTELGKRIDGIGNELGAMRQSARDSSAWLELIRQHSDIRELDRIVLSELVDRITVGEARIEDGEKIVDVTIYYRFIGAVGQLTA
jgi:DNA invertase Pin-like site-specific DNA recombinase